MSTRAIITVKQKVEGEGPKSPGIKYAGEEIRRLYCHGDGYPSYLGIRVYNFLNAVKSMGQHGKVHKKVWDWSTSGGRSRYEKISPRGRAYSSMANVLWEADQFLPALTTYLHSKGYGGTYLTNRDPEEEAKRDWTDIEWHYVITLPPFLKAAKPKLEVYEHMYDEHRTPKGWFVKKTASMPELVEKELEERRRYRAEYEKKQKAEEQAKKRSARASSGLHGMR